MEITKNMIKRDSLIVIPTFVFTCIWIFVLINSDISPLQGADYGTSMALGLLLPLSIIGAVQTAYALVLITDIIRISDKSNREKVLLCIGAWFAATYLFFAVYIYRVVRFHISKNRSTDTARK